MPKLSIVIPVYNRPVFVRRAVSSVLAQTVDDWELLICDDGSDEPVENALTGLLDPRISCLRQEHRGVAAARNLGIEKARSEWIALLDSDDYWLPDKIEKQMNYMADNPELLLSQCREIWYRNDVRVNMAKQHEQPEGDAFISSLRLCVISSSSVVLKRQVYTEVGGYDELLPICEDYDFWLRVTSRYLVGLVPEKVVVKHGGHADQLSRAEPALDRYRVYSLLKLLRSGVLTSAQLPQVVDQIAAKTRVLAQGARKRNSALLYLWDALLVALAERQDGAEGVNVFESVWGQLADALEAGRLYCV